LDKEKESLCNSNGIETVPPSYELMNALTDVTKGIPSDCSMNVSLARAMGADVVIAVDLSSEMLDHHLTKDTGNEAAGHSIGDWIRRLQENLAGRLSADSPEEGRLPAMRDVVASSINIMQVRIARSRLAGDPPDVVVSPRLGRFGLFDFHRAGEAMAEGRRATEAVRQNLDRLRK